MLLPILYTQASLSNDEIREQLHRLRQHAHAQFSGFAVAALLEYSLDGQSYAYVGGVNVENSSHNHLTVHAEQNAIATAQTLLGGNVKFSRMWVMGALRSVQADTQTADADLECRMCGQCRQIALSVSSKNAMAYAVTVSGKFSEAYAVDGVLPFAFSERDLQLPILEEEKSESKLSGGSTLFKAVSSKVSPAVSDLFLEAEELSKEKILKYLRLIKPHVINEQFKTSAIVSCILKVCHENKNYYVPGALAQDVAFLSTDAIFTAIACAVTQFGGTGFRCVEVHLHTDNLGSSLLSGAEWQALSEFSAKKNVLIHAYDSHRGSVYALTLKECAAQWIDSMLQEDEVVSEEVQYCKSF